MANPMRTEALHVTSPAPREAWVNLLRSSADALAFQTPGWLDCICEIGGYADASRLYETSSGRRLVLPMARRVHVPGALTTEASLPYGWGFGGVVAPDALHEDEAAGVLADLAGQPVLRASVRPNPLVAATWAAAAPPSIITVSRVAHVLDLDGGFERVWKDRFVSEARTAVRKAERAALSVECDTSGALVPIFYDLYLRSIDRWARQGREPLLIARWRGRRRDPLCKFQLAAQRLGDACRIWVAWLNGQPAAAIIVLIQGATASYWRGAMDEDLAGPTRANNLLHRRAIEDACLAGCRYYHMGETGSSTALAQFKSRFGASAHPYIEYHLERLPITKVSDRLRRLARRVMGRLTRL